MLDEVGYKRNDRLYWEQTLSSLHIQISTWKKKLIDDTITLYSAKDCDRMYCYFGVKLSPKNYLQDPYKTSDL